MPSLSTQLGRHNAYPLYATECSLVFNWCKDRQNVLYRISYFIFVGKNREHTYEFLATMLRITADYNIYKELNSKI